ncbi:hypothetical protein G7054_g8323 [Neopestalotiopsis clavispora]|nr:hypothetical protein G7054_g8323 [Neopestalotiopsis clavispora]
MSAQPAASTPPPRQSERPFTPRQHNIEHGLLSRVGDIVAFATSATEAVREECGALAAHQPHSIGLRLRNSAPLREDRLMRLLSCLERLIQWPNHVSEPRVPYHQLRFPRLEQLGTGRRIPVRTAQSVRKCIRDLATSQETKARDTRAKLETSFTAFANVKKSAIGPGISDLARPAAMDSSGDEHAKYLQSFYTSLRKISHCNKSISANSFTANIAVVNNSHDLPKDNPFGRDIAFQHHHAAAGGQGEWKHARIHMRKGPQNYAQEVNAMATSNEVLNLCQVVRSKDVGRLNLTIVDEKIFRNGYEMAPEACRLSLSGKAISLADLLDSECLENEEQYKALLSCMLAKAVWQFYESDWMTEPWTKRTVQFMQRHASLPQNKIYKLDYRPYISTVLAASPDQTTVAIAAGDRLLQQNEAHDNTLQPSHIYPKILALGILLLNIELGYDFFDKSSVNADPDYLLRPNAQHQIAAEFIGSSKWKNRGKVKKAVRQVIEVCIKPDTSLLGRDSKLVRERLLSKVVQPLETLFAQQWDCKDDQVENFDPRHIKAEFLLNKINDAQQCAESPAQNAYPGGSADDSINGEQGLASQMSNFHLHDWQLFGDEVDDLHHMGTAATTDAWVAEFQAYLRHYQFGRDKRIKVAIIDTGIDMNHECIKEEVERIPDWKSFVPGEDATVDRVGHGTHIAGIVLKLTSNVDLYIAKTFSKRDRGEEGSMAVRERIAQALLHCREEWHVDMISLSFGYRKPTVPDVVWDEISRCLKDDVVVFAAASNDGGNKPHTYPGRYEGVLCIHSATGEGNASIFNPSPAEMHGDNLYFHFVGEELESYWTLDVPHDFDPPSPDLQRRRSGTSFATPVAVATAAFMVEYLHRTLEDHYWEIKPLSPLGIKKIFLQMSHKRYHHRWIDLGWYFSEHDQEYIRQHMKHHLGARALRPTKGLTQATPVQE